MFDIQDGVLKKYSGTDAVVTIPKGVVRIGERAFYENRALKKVIFPEGVTEIGDEAFTYCYRLSEVVWPASLRRIGTSAFGGADLTALHLPASVEGIDDIAFASNTKLVRVYLPDAVNELGVYAFSRCERLAEVSLPYMLKEIDDTTFSDCPMLRTLHIRKDGRTITLPLERELDDAYWQEFRRNAAAAPAPKKKFAFDMSELLKAAEGKEETTAPPKAAAPPQSNPLEQRVAALESELSTLGSELSELRKLVISQQMQIARLMKRGARRKITSFHPLSEEELRRIGRN